MRRSGFILRSGFMLRSSYRKRRNCMRTNIEDKYSRTRKDQIAGLARTNIESYDQ